MPTIKAPFKRVYVDIPPETHRKLAVKAAQVGTPMKKLLADMIEKECSNGKPATQQRSKKRGSKKK